MEKKELKFVQYTTKKVVDACKMSRKEAEERMGRKVYPDSDEREDEEGFFIVYPDRYMSWCPAPIFYKFYHRSDSHVDRMKIEREEVKERYLKGREFTFSDEFREKLDAMDRKLLLEQLDEME